MDNRPQSINHFKESHDDHNDSEVADSDSSSFSGSSSSQSLDTEWAGHIENDGSLIYVESYITTTVKERAHLALKEAASESEKKIPLSSPSKNIKHHTKLLNLLKRRPSVRVKSSDSNKHVTSTTATDSNLKVTFRDNPSGAARRVILKVTEYGNNYGRRASLCETVLGIMPGRFSEAPDSRVMVAGLAPGSQALKDGIIKIGDWLMEVDSKVITWDNLDNLLLDIQIPTTVVLQVQKCASETLPHEDINSDKQRITQTQLVKLISGSENRYQEYLLAAENGTMPRYTVLYLSLQEVTEDSPDKEDIKYQFPSLMNKLVQVRGMFITAAHSLQEVIGTPVLCSTVILEGDYYNVGYCREENDVFLIALPDTFLTRSEVIILTNQIKNLIVYEFGSLANGFCNSNNRDHLDHLFMLLFEDIFYQSENPKITTSLLDENIYPLGLPTVADVIGWHSNRLFTEPSWLILKDDESKVLIETCLNELESGDFGEDESDCEDCQLLYNILGCCIFYKGHLVNSHLDYESSLDVYTFLHYHKLLQLTAKEALSQMILWKRVFPKQEDLLPTSGKVMHYLLVVAMNHILLAMLVESGNVTELMDELAGPDVFLIDQAETTLYHLHSMHVHAACEESLNFDSIETISLDNKTNLASPPKKTKQKSSDNLEGMRTPDVPSILKQRSYSESPHHSNLQEFPPCNCERSSGDGIEDCPSPSCSKDSSFTLPDNDDDEEDDKENNSSDSDFKLWKGSDSRSGYVYSPEVGSAFRKGDPSHALKITVGRDSVLLHFLQIDTGEGVFVTQTSNSLTPASSPLHTELIHNFYATCSHIRHVLHTGLRNKITNSNYSGVPVMNNIKEYGIMFECSTPNQPSLNSSKKKNPSLYYWVIGRIYGAPYEREIYVALEDSIPQNIQEIAFKMALGTS